MVLVTKTKRPSSIHHKRRQGQHHKRSHDYSKPYWPYLPLGIVVGLGLLANVCWGAVQHAVLGYATNTSVSGLVSKTNEERAEGGLAALTISDKLNQAAQAKASDMAARNYWSHNTPDGNPPWVFFSNAGYDYSSAGENLAYGFDNSSATVTAWMNSAGHRANIMNGDFTEVGFGIANIGNYQDTGAQTIVVAMYGTPQVASATATADTLAQQPSAYQQQSAAAGRSSPDMLTPVTPQNEVASSSQKVARIQLVTGMAAPWTILTITVIATGAIIIVFLRHSLVWHRRLLRGEQFILRHKFLDIVLVLVGVIGFVLTRSAGAIH